MGKREGAKRGGAAKIGSGNHLVMGRNTVLELLRAEPDRIEKLFIAGASNAAGRAAELVQAAEKKGIKIVHLSAEDLGKLLHSDSHQGVAAEVSSGEKETLFDFVDAIADKPRSLLVLLDELNDPHNLGAVFRAAECLGAAAIVWSRNRGVQIGPVVSKVSSGASEFVPWFEVSNLVDTVRSLKESGYWLVGAESAENAVALESFEFPEKCALILGSEGTGIKPLLAKQCDFKVAIPMSGRIDSLNVSQAAAVFMYVFRRQQS